MVHSQLFRWWRRTSSDAHFFVISISEAEALLGRNRVERYRARMPKMRPSHWSFFSVFFIPFCISLAVNTSLQMHSIVTSGKKRMMQLAVKDAPVQTQKDMPSSQRIPDERSHEKSRCRGRVS